MACEHKFDYVGDEKAGKNSNRYFRCSLCGCVKVRSDDGAEYIIPGRPQKDE